VVALSLGKGTCFAECQTELSAKKLYR
jgi:hypothetical protein